MNNSPNPNDSYKRTGFSDEAPTPKVEETDSYREEPTPATGEGRYFDNTEYYRMQGEPERFEEPPNGLGVASLICGLIGLVFCSGCCPPLSIVAIVLAAMDRKKARRFRGWAIGGLVTGILGLVSTLMLIGVFALLFIIGMAEGGYALQMLMM